MYGLKPVPFKLQMVRFKLETVRFRLTHYARARMPEIGNCGMLKERARSSAG
jgi:hypothetical protein